MQNETKLSSDMINSFLQMMKNGKDGQQNIKKILNDSLDSKQKEAVGKIMSDPEKLRQILSSPQAKELMKKFGNTGNGDNKNGSS